MATIYTGPGKVYYGGIAMQPEGENGPLKIVVKEERTDAANAMFGRVGSVLVDQTAEIDYTPFSDWLLLPTLLPPWVGSDTSAIVTGTAGSAGGSGTGAAALAIGFQPHTAANIATKAYGYDKRLINFVRTAITGHPTLSLAPNKSLFGGVKISAIGDNVTPVAMGASGYLIAGNAITEPGAGTDPGSSADPQGNMALGSFVQVAWTGAFDSVTGFTAIQAEDGWEITCDAKYSTFKISGRTLGMKLDSVQWMAKCRPFGPTATQIVGRIGAHTQGQLLGSVGSPLALVLTGTNSKTITLQNCEPVGAGFEFGGTSLGLGEIGFVTQTSFTSGAATAFITFSA